MNSSKVTVYIRHSGTRKYQKANAKTFTGYKGKLIDGSTFALRFTDAQGKRQYETLGCETWDEAQEAAFYKRIELSKIKRGEMATPAPKPTPVPKPVIQTQAPTTDVLMLDAAIDRYLT